MHPMLSPKHGAIMAATVLNTARATEVSVYVVRAFVQLREVLATHKELAKRLDELETKIERKLATHDQAIAGIITAIRELMAPPEPKQKRPNRLRHTQREVAASNFSSGNTSPLIGFDDIRDLNAALLDLERSLSPHGNST
jgi:hypothetical protein